MAFRQITIIGTGLIGGSFALALKSAGFAGRIIDKLDTKWGYAWAIIVWSLGAIIHAVSLPVGEAVSTLLGWVGIGAVSFSIAGFMVSRTVLAAAGAGMRNSNHSPVLALDDTALADRIFINITPRA